jgi:hypothetical protein
MNDLYIPEELLADAIQEGVMGICDAIASFDVSSLDTFTTHVSRRVRRRIQNFLFAHVFFIRLPSNWYYVYCRFANQLYNCPTNRAISAVEDQWRAMDACKYSRLLGIQRVAKCKNLYECGADLECERCSESEARCRAGPGGSLTAGVGRLPA